MTRAMLERRRRVAIFLCEGLSEREIARRLGWSRSTVWSDKQAMVASRYDSPSIQDERSAEANLLDAEVGL